MPRNHDWDVFASEEPTEVHHKDCQNTPEAPNTGDCTAVVVQNPDEYTEDDETFDVACSCLDPLLGSDRHEEEA